MIKENCGVFALYNAGKLIELLGKLIAYEKDFHSGIVKPSEKIKGPYSLVILTRNGIYATRDPYGFKP